MPTGNNTMPTGCQPTDGVDPDSPAGRLVTKIYGPGRRAAQNGRMTWILPIPENNTDPTDTDEDMRTVLDEWLEAAGRTPVDKPYDSSDEATNDNSGRETIRFDRGGTITAILERARKRVNHNQGRQR
ncbi:hypothetical protein PT279_07795 [Bifidobacterium sp. ESL0784]|uniref:hypothetical protein n=1 Tax=Bifidobacterium sp. ESL0784 TaxID=2983231 RepID=UPI0023FA1A9E|nr:hypothetical protein [Bifidobacterium sp. ESL0784]MDF7641485.1 hypothetical protein [Bifidobacterium sp. ESL0784]